jgi:CubicO group peptidase (beta-lactamase class C family)
MRAFELHSFKLCGGDVRSSSRWKARSALLAVVVVMSSCGEDELRDETTAEDCSDLSDNDRDGLVDCEDSGCWHLEACGRVDGDADVDADGDADGDDDVPARFRPLVEVIERELAALGAPGVAVAVIEGGEVVFAAGFGSRRPGEQDPVEPTTLFRIASVTKMLTTVGLLQLVEDGDVVLSAPITDYLPDFAFIRDPSWASSITVEHLLTHASGMYDYIAIDGDREDSALSEFLNGEFGELVYLMAPAGRMYNYTNPGYMLAGLVTETVSGTYYRTYLTENVLAPLGMSRTFFLPSEVLADGDYATGDTTDWETGNPMLVEPETYDNAWARPAGFAYSSVLDLARFVAFLRDGDPAVLGDAERAAMQSPRIDTEMFLDLVHYGYGLLVSEGGFYGPGAWDFYDVRVVMHDGALPGFSSELFYVPELDVGFVTLANTDGAYFYESFAAVLHTIADMPRPVASPDLTMSREELESFAGDYLDPYNVGRVQVSLDGERLVVSMPDLDALGIPYDEELTPTSPRNFMLGLQGWPVAVTFILDEGGAVEYLRTRYFVAARVAAGAPPGPRAHRPPPGLAAMLRRLRQVPPEPLPFGVPGIDRVVE